MKYYVFITKGEADVLNFSEVCEESLDKLRFSLDGSQTFVRYDNSQPFSFAGKQEYSESEVADIVKGSEWIADEEI